MNQLHKKSYEGTPIQFKAGDSVWVNATEMAKKFGKLPKDFLKTTRTQEYIDALCGRRKILPSDLQRVTNGNNGGTWMHEDLALEFARWLSPKFSIWCNDRIKEIMKSQSFDPTILSRKKILMLALEAEEKVERLEKEVETLQPKAQLADKVINAEGLYSMREAAQMLNFGKVGQNKLFKFLKSRRVLSANNLPYQRYINQKLFKVKVRFVDTSHGQKISRKTLVTGKGLEYIKELLDRVAA